MAIPLLKTKLYVPAPRFGLVPRPRLIERLCTGIHPGCKLTLVSAPAGFGKTTLVSDWIHQANRPAAWLSLDEGDNDPVRFWSYVTAALQTIPGFNEAGAGAAFLAALQTLSTQQHTSVSTPRNGAGQIKSILTGLINELAECSDPLILVLDDLHAITREQIHDTLLFLLHGLPPHVHLIVSTRTDPPWPLARLRVRGEITELRVKDLRFTLDEAAAFLNDVKALDLSAEDVTALDARTEGWIAGLQMAALSMQGRHNRTAFIHNLGGSHHFILDYLVQEVLARQTGDIQDFMLQTSILKRLTASLCDALTGRGDSQTVLIRLEQNNLFLTSLDDERRWYRYHPLFADLLRNRLEQNYPDQVSVLHRRASAWHERNELVAEAVNHAFAAEDTKRVARLVEENAFAMMDHGELTTLVAWFDALPGKMVRSQPWLCVAYAWVLIYTGRMNALDPLLLDAEESLRDLSTGQADFDMRAAGHISAIRAYILVLRGNMSCGTKLARRALELLPEQDLTARSWTMSLLANALRWSGELTAADRTFSQASAITREGGDSHVAVDVLCDWAGLQIMQGRLHKAAETCRDALTLADNHLAQSGQRLPVTGYAHIRLSVVLWQWNDLEAALRHAREGIRLFEQWGWTETLVGGYIILAKVLDAMGDMDGALDATQKARRVAHGVSPWFEAHIAALEARLWLAQGNTKSAYRWASQESTSANNDAGFEYEFVYLALAWVRIAQGRLDEALELLARLLEAADSARAMGYGIEILILQALAHRAQGQVERSLTALERSLSLAEPEGYVRTFIGYGEPMGVLLRQAAARGIRVDYVRTLLAALERETTTLETPPAVHPPLIEPLTERELEVLRLLVVGLSNKAIAGTLVIAVGTVKQHLKHIYGKLEVHNRTEAARRAGEWGLV